MGEKMTIEELNEHKSALKTKINSLIEAYHSATGLIPNVYTETTRTEIGEGNFFYNDFKLIVEQTIQ